MEKIFRKIKRFVKGTISLIITLAIILIGGSFVLANIETGNGTSLYDVVAGTIKIEMDSVDTEGGVEKGIAAAKSTISAITGIDFNGGSDVPQETASVKQTSKKPAPAKSGGGNAAVTTEGAPAVEQQAQSEAAADGQPAAEEQPEVYEEAQEPDVAEEQPEAAGEAAPDTSSGSYKEGYAAQVLDLVNQERANAGLAPLSWNPAAASAARTRSNEIVTQFSHARPGGRSGITALNESGAGYSLAGENIAAGQSSAGEVVNSWMNSPAHRANILKPEYTSLGVACIYVPGSDLGYYWVQLFVG